MSALHEASDSVAPKAAAQPKLVVSDVVKEYPAEAGPVFQALSRVSLSAPDGQLLCLLGPSGCGKTTLLNLIAGFLQPTAGSVRIDGTAVTQPGADRGLVFQDYALFPWLTVRRNVQFGPRMRGASREEQERVAEKYLRMVGLESSAERYPHQLSGGMKQRVAIARAFANKPGVLLMDEPFGALDAMTRETLQEELRRLCALEPRLTIFVTHSVPEAVYLADRVVVMAARPGRIIADIVLDEPHPRDRTSEQSVARVREIRALLQTGPQPREPHEPKEPHEPQEPRERAA
ncbi:MAG TPA: ABC transporter ATP-binding protein [Ramlibacter sp.]|uniref:ABC transporter ATP-binding protein n=1 Tax=Ramlibacter sp. TaxID=1917967 RepID=UPI002C7676C7|nr:ABC transporter ATP-binding protein [Ramlibacter sp.]HVZ46344.1 ABC transporter ATP-binding protein [Ramlibacter sp.]